jgi:hypothetical protein
MPAQNGRETIGVERESALHYLTNLRRWNLLTSPLFRLPTEVILRIFAHTVELDDQSWLALTAICHRLREISISCSRLWGTVDFSSPVHVIKMFLERCNFDPHVFLATDLYPSVEADRVTMWEELQGRTMGNLRSLVFQGSEQRFDRRVLDLLRRAPNLSSLEVDTYTGDGWELESFPGDQIPQLSTLRLREVRISWSSPLLRNLTGLILSYRSWRAPSESPSAKTFFAALASCPDLETLQLSSAGPDLPDGNQDDHQAVIRLPKLKGVVLRFDDHNVVGYILSHIWFPESTVVEVEAGYDGDLSVALSQIIPHPDTETFQRLRRTKSVTVETDKWSYALTANNFHFSLLPPHKPHTLLEDPNEDPGALTRFASKVVEITGSDTVTSLNLKFDLPFGLPFDIFLGLWKELLHGFSRLEEVSYFDPNWPHEDFVDPFCLVLSQPFEEGLVCPRLWDLRIPDRVAQGLSAVALKSALAERSARGRRLKRISLSLWMEEDEVLVLEHFEDVVEEHPRPQDFSWSSLFVSGLRE